MGYFGTVDQREFDDFKKVVLTNLAELRENIDHRVSDSEEVAKAAALTAQAIELRLKTAEIEVNSYIHALESFKSEASVEVESIRSSQQAINDLSSNLQARIEVSVESLAEIIESKGRLANIEEEVASKVALLTKYLEEGKNLPAGVEATNQLLGESREVIATINKLYEHAVKRKKEIDSLYSEIYGEDLPDSEGGYEHTDGIKDALEASYKSILVRLETLDQEMISVVKEVDDEHERLMQMQRTHFESLIAQSNEKVDSIYGQLTGLLPGAMAEGLSAAYDKKKDDEILSLTEFQYNFKLAIFGMILVSLIPLCVDFYLIFFDNRDLIEVIKETPAMIAAILPLYFPILWMAHSSNKKYNLSKRLIEEYTHKAVLGKTFSGLSNQIESLQHVGTVKEELRNRLLHNVLQVSAENPGKLITDYQKSDHPLMEALENSVKLAESISKLSKIPGFSAMAKKITERNEKINKELDEKVETGLDDEEALNKNQEK